MKYVVLIAILLTTVVAFAQESPPVNLESFMQRSEQTQTKLLETGHIILQRLEAIEKNLTSERASLALGPEYAALEKRLSALEAALAKVPDGAPAPAAEAAPAADVQANINAVWIVVAGAMVFLMQAGFCLLELGLTRAKNAINICMKNFLDFCVGTICFFFVGFGLMFGKSLEGFIGTGPFWISDIPSSSQLWAFWFFQLVFCGTAATIISGAMAERTKFIGYLFYTAVMTAAIYPIIGHWAWGSFGEAFGFGGGEGWLQARGYVDFAGSGVVHAIGGAAALAGIIVVGPRLGRFRPDGSANLMSGHNIPLAALGTFILWFGWYGFNPGSTLVGDSNIGRIAVNTTLAPAAGALMGMFAMWLHQGRPDLIMTMNGALGGLVGITANCHAVTPISAVMIGLVAGIIATFGCLFLERLKLDDAVGAIPVHLFCGIWGVLALALFNQEGFSPEKLGVQALGVFSIAGAAFVGAFVVFFVIDKTIGLRAGEEEQDLGLDFTEHSGAAYPDFTTSEQELLTK
jgi:Amt family ammonium transporter